MSGIQCPRLSVKFLIRIFWKLSIYHSKFCPILMKKMRFSVILGKKNPIKLHFCAKIQLSCNHIFQLIGKSNSETYKTNQSELLGGEMSQNVFFSQNIKSQVFTLCPIFEKIGLFIFGDNLGH